MLQSCFNVEIWGQTPNSAPCGYLELLRHLGAEFGVCPQISPAVYGSEWRKMDDVLFTCTDGYQPLLPVEWFLKHYALFAVERVGAEFSVVNATRSR